MGINNENSVLGSLTWKEMFAVTLVLVISPNVLENFLSKILIYKSFVENKFTKLFKPCMIREMMQSMYLREFSEGNFILGDKEMGKHIFLIEEGKFEVKEEGKSEALMGSRGKLYGVEEFLLSVRRIKTIRAITKCKVWLLDRKAFRDFVKSAEPFQKNLKILRSFNLFKNVDEASLSKIADGIVLKYYGSQEIIHMNENTLYVISDGNAACIRKETGAREKIICLLGRGDQFQSQIGSTYQLIAFYPGVELLLFEMQTLHQLKRRNLFVGPRNDTASIIYATSETEYCANLKLDDLERRATLGRGSFGRVDLVSYPKDPVKAYALKRLEKYRTVMRHEQTLVINEREVLMMCKHPFIVRLHRTFRDERYVYMLLEACLGGPVARVLRKNKYFPEKTTRFITACIVEALEYLHEREIIYRDLKLDNIVIDHLGYVKLIDFGLSKQLGYQGKTWSFCGTPNYMAPEIILRMGHDRSVDYWALGLLIFELLCGFSYFSDTNPMIAYEQIIEGMEDAKFPQQMISRTAEDLVRKLCKREPNERLGYQKVDDIRTHKWFKVFNWNGLKSRTITPPFCLKPKLGHSYDTSYFDQIPNNDHYVPFKEDSNWDKVFE